MNKNPSDGGVDLGSAQVPLIRRSRVSSRRKLIIGAIAVAGVAGAIVVWQAGSAKSVDGSKSGRTSSTVAHSLDAGRAGGTASVGPFTAPPLAVAATSSGASSPTPTPPASTSSAAATAALAEELSELRQSCEDLSSRIESTDQRLDNIESDVTQVRQQLDKQEVVLARAMVRATRAAPRPPAAPATSERPAVPTILAVDVWNGRPSASVKVGSDIRFVAEGDFVADMLVKRADVPRQEVEFVSTAGASMVVMAAGGGAR